MNPILTNDNWNALTEGFRTRWWVAAVVAGVLCSGLIVYVAGADSVTEADIAVPAELPFARLDGSIVTRADLAGKPWVLMLWLPG